jgi:hypothetical protein
VERNKTISKSREDGVPLDDSQLFYGVNDSSDLMLRCASVCQVKTVVRHGGLRLVTLTQSRLTYELLISPSPPPVYRH